MYTKMSTAAKSRDDSMPNGANVLLSPSNAAQPSSPASSTSSAPSGQAQYTQLMPDDVQAVFKGVFTHKCQIPQKLRQIRLVLWSTQSDFEEERECFWFEILPELQQHCLQYGADILLFDPYQGSDFDPVYQPQLLNLLFQQIHDCRRQSEGVFFVRHASGLYEGENFLARGRTICLKLLESTTIRCRLKLTCLIGDKYGPCPLPTHLRSEEFQHIRTAGFEGGKDVRPLDDWYKLDQNTSPAAYVLQSSSSRKKLDAKALYDLQEVIQLGAHVAHQDGLINQVNQKCQERFFTSSVEMAIEHALSASPANVTEGYSLSAAQASTSASSTFSWTGPTLKTNASRCLFVLRKFEGIQHNATSNLSTYVDTTSQTYWNPQERLTNLKNCLSNAIDKANLETFRVNWEAGDTATWLRSKDRERYLEKFSQQVTYKLKQLIDRTFGFPSQRTSRRGSTTAATLQPAALFKGNAALKNIFESTWLHHQHTLASRPAKFIGRTDLLKRIRDTCKEAARRPVCPLIIQADDGGGRSAVLAEIAYHVSSNWLIGSTVICRYVLLNVQSQYVHELIRSVCLQLCHAHQLDDLLNAYREYYSADKMAEWLELACTETVRKTGQPVVILIDDIHQVKYGPHLGGKGQQHFTWLSSPLPSNVVVIGTVNAAFPLDQLPIRRWDTSKGLIKLPNLNETELMEMCKAFLAPLQRSVNVDQEGLLKSAFKASPSPAFVKFLAYEAAQWLSFQQVQSLTNNGGKSGGLAISSVAAYLDQKFGQLEKQFGYDVSQQICCYLECAYNGLTETELFDLLSCHRELMNKIYPEQGSVRLRRFPSNLWTRFKSELGPLIIFKSADGKTVLLWSQASIGNFIRHRYLNSSLQLKKCHTDLADLFSNTWANAESADAISSATEGKVVHKFVMPQPLRVNSESAAAACGEDGVLYNLRRVQCLWYHLLHSGAVDYFEEQSLCNFEYLEALLHATSLAHLLAIMDHALSQILNYNLHVLYGMVLRPALGALSHNQTLFAAELIGRLRYTRGRNTNVLNRLVEQAMTWVDNYSVTPLIVPLTCWIRPPLCPLVVTFRLQDWAPASTGTWTIVQPTLNYQHLLVTGNKNSTLIWMYHIASHTLVKTFAGHQDRVIWLEMSKNGQLFASSSADGTVRVWDLHQGTCMRNLSPHTDRAYAVIFSHDDQYLVTCGGDKTAKITCLETGRVMRTFEGHTGPVVTLALTSADDYVITGSSDFTVFIWDMEKGVKVSEISGLMAPVRCIQTTSNDTFLMVACEDETLKVFSLCLGTEIHELRGHEGKICCMATAIDDCQIFAGSSDGNIYCYDLHNAQLLSTQNCHSTAVTSLKVTADGHFLVSGSAENVHVWNVDRPGDQRRQDEGNHLTCIALSKDVKYAASGNYAGLVYLWDMEMCHCLWITCDDPPSTVSCLQFDPETSFLFSGSTTGVVSIWSMADGGQLKRYDNHTTPIRTIQIFSDRSRVLTHEASGVARVWLLHTLRQTAAPSASGAGGSGDADDGDRDAVVEVLTLKGCGDTLRLASDKDVIAKTADADKEMRIWNISMEDDSGVTLKAKLCHTDTITCLAMSSDAKLLVTGSADQSLKVWEGTTGYLTQVLVGHSESIVCCAINAMCTVVVSAAADNAVFSWDIDTGAIIAPFNEHKKPVTSVLLTPDGNIALSGGKDGWLYSWSTESGQQISCFNAQLPVADILTTPDAHRVVVRLQQCPHLAILCLHNCPVFQEPTSAKKRRQSRAMSMSSLASTGSLSSIGSGRDPAPTTAANASVGSSASGAAGPTAIKEATSVGPGTKRGDRNSLDRPPRSDRKQSKVFAQLERSRSRASLYDNPTSTTRLGAERASKEKQANKHSTANSASKVCAIL